MSGDSSSASGGTLDRSNTSSADACYGAAAAGESSDAQVSLVSSSTDADSRRRAASPGPVVEFPLPVKRTSPSPSALSTKGVAEFPLRPGREKTPRRSPPMPVAALPLQGPMATTPMIKPIRSLMPPRQLSRSRSESAGSGYGRVKGQRALQDEPYPSSDGRVVNDDAPHSRTETASCKWCCFCKRRRRGRR